MANTANTTTWDEASTYRDEIAERDRQMCEDYENDTTLTVESLAMRVGLSDRRVQQILSQRGGAIRRVPRSKRNAISKPHARLGLHLAEYRHHWRHDVRQSADLIGWSMNKLRDVERGFIEVDLLDAQCIATYRKTPLGKLLEITFAAN